MTITPLPVLLSVDLTNALIEPPALDDPYPVVIVMVPLSLLDAILVLREITLLR